MSGGHFERMTGTKSETAKVGTDEQKLDMRHGKMDKVAHHNNVQNRITGKRFYHVDSATIDQRKMHLPGGECVKKLSSGQF